MLQFLFEYDDIDVIYQCRFHVSFHKSIITKKGVDLIAKWGGEGGGGGGEVTGRHHEKSKFNTNVIFTYIFVCEFIKIQSMVQIFNAIYMYKLHLSPTFYFLSKGCYVFNFCGERVSISLVHSM